MPALQLDAASMPAAPSVWSQKLRERQEQARTHTAPWSPGAAGDQVKQAAPLAAAPLTTLQAAPHADKGAAAGADAAGKEELANGLNGALPRAGPLPAGAAEHVDLQDSDCSPTLHHSMHLQPRLPAREGLEESDGSHKVAWDRGAGGPGGSDIQSCDLMGLAEKVRSHVLTHVE